MDVLAGYQNRAFAPLDDISVILGFPGKMGVSGSQVWSLFQEGKIKEIRDYCETDVLNTFLVYLRFEHIRDGISADQLQQEESRLAAMLEDSDATHLREYLEAWRPIQHEG
jgi:predicted PolB exonuclease-like 3'-5' exonuclease